MRQKFVNFVIESNNKKLIFIDYIPPKATIIPYLIVNQFDRDFYFVLGELIRATFYRFVHFYSVQSCHILITGIGKLPSFRKFLTK